MATLTLAACGGGASNSAVGAAQSAAAQISHAVSSGGAAATASDTTTDPATDSSSGDSSCDLVSRQQVSSIVHVDYTNTSMVGGICFFTNGDSSGAGYSYTTYDNANCWAQISQGDDKTPVPGVGDAAVGNALGLDVEHGSTCITVGGGTPAEQQGDWSADAAVARIIIGNLR